MKKITHAPRYSARLIGAAAGLPIPQAEYRFHGIRRWRFDFAWPEAHISLEVEGGQWISGRHNRGSGAIKDMEKYNHAAAMGWLVFRVDPKKVYSACVGSLIREAYALQIDIARKVKGEAA